VPSIEKSFNLLETGLFYLTGSQQPMTGEETIKKGKIKTHKTTIAD